MPMRVSNDLSKVWGERSSNPQKESAFRRKPLLTSATLGSDWKKLGLLFARNSVLDLMPTL